MCGIAGILSHLEDKEAGVNAMLTALHHRGPDAEGKYSDRLVALGHRRLSIIDLSESANQPMSDPSGNYVMVYNGELYNYKEIKKGLRHKYNFQTESDSEVILAAFIHYGVDCVKKFNGNFAFAIWDKVKEQLFLARDHVGIKPLFWYRDQQQFIFCSELKAMLKSGLFIPALSHQGLADYLMYQSAYEPNTIISGVYQLRAGHYMIVKDNHADSFNYWDITEKSSKNYNSYAETCSMIKDCLYGAVERQLVSDVPLALFLSGGIDSSVLASIATKISPDKINTFSIGFHNTKYDESVYSEMMAKSIKSNHINIKVNPELFLEMIPETLMAMSSPSGDGPNTYMISKIVANEGIKVALSGLGGDELFCGYQHFNTYDSAQRYKHMLPDWGYHIIGNLLLKTGNRKLRKAGEILNLKSFEIWDFYPITRQLFNWKEILKLSPHFNYTYDTAHANLVWLKGKIDTFPTYSQYSIAELLGYTKNVLLEDADQMSMARSLELRVPFLDKELIELCLPIPDKFKHPHGYKKLLIDSVGHDIPNELIHRKKMGFSFPWDQWMKKELYIFCNTNLSSLKERQIFDGHEIDTIWKKYQANDPSVLWGKVWLLVVLESWLQNNHIRN